MEVEIGVRTEEVHQLKERMEGYEVVSINTKIILALLNSSENRIGKQCHGQRTPPASGYPQATKRGKVLACKNTQNNVMPYCYFSQEQL